MTLHKTFFVPTSQGNDKNTKNLPFFLLKNILKNYIYDIDSQYHICYNIPRKRV